MSLKIRHPMLNTTSINALTQAQSESTLVEWRDWAGVQALVVFGNNQEGDPDGSYPPWWYEENYVEPLKRIAKLCQKHSMDFFCYFHPYHSKLSGEQIGDRIAGIIHMMRQCGFTGVYLDGADLGSSEDETVWALIKLFRMDCRKIGGHISFSPHKGYTPVIPGRIAARLSFILRGEHSRNPAPTEPEDPIWGIWYAPTHLRQIAQYKNGSNQSQWGNLWSPREIDGRSKKGPRRTQYLENWERVESLWNVSPWVGVGDPLKWIIKWNKGEDPTQP